MYNGIHHIVLNSTVPFLVETKKFTYIALSGQFEIVDIFPSTSARNIWKDPVASPHFPVQSSLRLENYKMSRMLKLSLDLFNVSKSMLMFSVVSRNLFVRNLSVMHNTLSNET